MAVATGPSDESFQLQTRPLRVVCLFVTVAGSFAFGDADYNLNQQAGGQQGGVEASLVGANTGG